MLLLHPSLLLSCIAVIILPSSSHASVSSSSFSTREVTSALGIQQQQQQDQSWSRRRGYWGKRRSSEFNNDDNDVDDVYGLLTEDQEVQQCSATRSIARTLFDGAALRVASDITLGTPLESIKCRVTGTLDGPLEATRNIIKNGGIGALWTGTPSRTVEGALLGCVYMLGASATKTQLATMGVGPTLTALCAGLVGGVAQSVVMTPCGLIFTSLNLNKGKEGYENDNAIVVAKRIMKEKGAMGMYHGIGPMAARQASNWASRACFTEICRTGLKLSRFGMAGEIASGCIGGVGGCWNTPIETIRVLMHADLASGAETKSFGGYWNAMVEEQGYPGLFRGIKPRAVQAAWQTVFMVTVPNIMGL